MDGELAIEGLVPISVACERRENTVNVDRGWLLCLTRVEQ
jgi:hypothetical protein